MSRVTPAARVTYLVEKFFASLPDHLEIGEMLFLRKKLPTDQSKRIRRIAELHVQLLQELVDYKKAEPSSTNSPPRKSP